MNKLSDSQLNGIIEMVEELSEDQFNYMSGLIFDKILERKGLVALSASELFLVVDLIPAGHPVKQKLKNELNRAGKS